MVKIALPHHNLHDLQLKIPFFMSELSIQPYLPLLHLGSFLFKHSHNFITIFMHFHHPFKQRIRNFIFTSLTLVQFTIGRVSFTDGYSIWAIMRYCVTARHLARFVHIGSTAPDMSCVSSSGSFSVLEVDGMLSITTGGSVVSYYSIHCVMKFLFRKTPLACFITLVFYLHVLSS